MKGQEVICNVCPFPSLPVAHLIVKLDCDCLESYLSVSNLMLSLRFISQWFWISTLSVSRNQICTWLVKTLLNTRFNTAMKSALSYSTRLDCFLNNFVYVSKVSLGSRFFSFRDSADMQGSPLVTAIYKIFLLSLLVRGIKVQAQPSFWGCEQTSGLCSSSHFSLAWLLFFVCGAWIYALPRSDARLLYLSTR